MRFILAVAASMLLFSSCQKICPMCTFPGKDDPKCKTDLKSGLLAYYPFDGDFKDASGNGLHGDPRNGVKLGTSIHGLPNSAAAFDGKDDYILVTDNGKLTSPVVTVSVWVLSNTSDRSHGILSRTNFDDTRGTTWGLGQSLATPNQWQFGVPSSVQDCNSYHTYDQSQYLNSTENIEKGQWYSIIASFANGQQKIYVDGVLRSTMPRDFSALKNCTNNQLVIGGWWKNDLLPIDGKIDEVRIYNRTLTDCEIRKLSSTFE